MTECLCNRYQATGRCRHLPEVRERWSWKPAMLDDIPAYVALFAPGGKGPEDV